VFNHLFPSIDAISVQEIQASTCVNQPCQPNATTAGMPPLQQDETLHCNLFDMREKSAEAANVAAEMVK
jgi:hypothetical protein